MTELDFERVNERLIEGLSHEPLVEEMARWVEDESYELGYEPDLSDLLKYTSKKYGVHPSQTIEALAVASIRQRLILDAQT